MTYLPNILTIGRMVLVVPFIGLFYLSDTVIAAWVTFAIFVLAAITDFYDGWLARRFGITSGFGRIFDPIADKVLVTSALLMLVSEARASVIAVALILVREMLISGIREGLAGRITLPVNQLGKWKTAAQMVAIGLLLIAPALSQLNWPLVTTGITILWLSVFLTWLSALLYLRDCARQWSDK